MRTRDRPKVLCLGMSYANIPGQIKHEGFRSDVLDHLGPTSSINRVVECVLRNVLTEMDGRDLARCLAMEQYHRVDAYTVSQEQGAVYDDTKHVHANFNRASFCKLLKKTFGKEIKFRQIILDYFWIPQGTWMMTHWTKSFFQNTLPLLVDLLEDAREQTKTGLECGVIYLPFCYHCVREIVASLGVLEQFYEISFIRKDKLKHHGLWSGTKSISPIVMQETFGKQIDQEEMYCTFSPRDVSEAMDDSTVTKKEVVKYLRCIEDFEDVRMIQLKPLPLKQRGVGQQLGGFVHLSEPGEVERGYDQLLSNRVTDYSSDEESEISVRKKAAPTKRKAPLPITKRKRIPQKDKTPKEPTLYSLVEDLHTYGLLDDDENIASYYKLPPAVHKTMFPDFQRSFWEICTNHHNARTSLDRTTVELLNETRQLAEIIGKKKGDSPSKQQQQLSATSNNKEPENPVIEDAAAKLVLFKRNLKLYPCVPTVTGGDKSPVIKSADGPSDETVDDVEDEQERSGLDDATDTEKDEMLCCHATDREDQTIASLSEGRVHGGLLGVEVVCDEELEEELYQSSLFSLCATPPSSPVPVEEEELHQSSLLSPCVATPSNPSASHSDSLCVEDDSSDRAGLPGLRINLIWGIDMDPQPFSSENDQPLGAEVFYTVRASSPDDESTAGEEADNNDMCSCPMENGIWSETKYWDVDCNPQPPC